MDFLKKLFGNDSSIKPQENFVVDATGNAQEVSSASIQTQTSTPAQIPNPAQNPAQVSVPSYTPEPEASNSILEKVPESVSETSVNQIPEATSVSQANDSTDKGEFVGDTSAFDELMKQAESSADSNIVDPSMSDPEFQKAKEEIEKEGGIEIFASE